MKELQRTMGAPRLHAGRALVDRTMRPTGAALRARLRPLGLRSLARRMDDRIARRCPRPEAHVQERPSRADDLSGSLLEASLSRGTACEPPPRNISPAWGGARRPVASQAAERVRPAKRPGSKKHVSPPPLAEIFAVYDGGLSPHFRSYCRRL